MEKYQIDSTEEVTLGRFRIIKHKLLVEGERKDYSYVDVKPAVVVMAFYEGKVIVISQYRLPIDTWAIEFPGGMIDKGEAPKDAAIRELQEETGYLVSEIFDAGYYHPSQGSTNEKIHLFIAKCKIRGEMHLDATEQVKVQLMTLEEIEALAHDNKILHGCTLSLLYKYYLFEKRGELGFLKEENGFD